MHADHGEALEEAGPGDIVTLVGLKDTATGDTLCDRAAPILLEPPAFPEPVISLVVEPASSAERVGGLARHSERPKDGGEAEASLAKVTSTVAAGVWTRSPVA